MLGTIWTIILGIIALVLARKIVLGWERFKMKAAGADGMFFSMKTRLASIGIIAFLIWMLLVEIAGGWVGGSRNFHRSTNIRQISAAIQENTARRVADENIPGNLALTYEWGLASVYEVTPLGSAIQARSWLVGHTRYHAATGTTPRMLQWLDFFNRDDAFILNLAFRGNEIHMLLGNDHSRDEAVFTIIDERRDRIYAERDGVTLRLTLEGNTLSVTNFDDDGNATTIWNYMPLHVIFFGG
ncbi:MAG: hypothetical protein FWB88_11420 [Defluviitaleaceae bacterium]|nr:hypothetical protein [Defluviitaleaceae bacterium]